MQRIAIQANVLKSEALESAQAAYVLLQNMGVQPVYECETASALGLPPLFDPAQTECMIVIGGDGTVLRSCGRYAKFGIAFLGVNLGRIGFLTEIELDALQRSLQALKNGAYEIEQRLLLQGSVGNNTWAALNDFIVKKSEGANTIHTSVKIDGNVVWSTICDGLIISSPTGSTAYSLSAGGPIVAPGSSVMMLVPICAHALAVRPLVVGESAVFDVSVTGNAAVISCDGQPIVPDFKPGDTFAVRSGAYKARFISFGAHNFYERLKRKLY